jgi:hypothetical protein
MTPEEREVLEAEPKLVKRIVELLKVARKKGINLEKLNFIILRWRGGKPGFEVTLTLKPEEREESGQDV